jgi:colicin import membrane protein
MTEETPAQNSLESLKERRKKYTSQRVGKGRDARITIDCNDNIAEKLRGMHIEEVYSAAASELGVSAKSLKQKYGHLNLGMQRMNLGNRIRGSVNKRNKAA